MLKHSSALTLKVRGADEIEKDVNKDRPAFKLIKGSIFKTKVQTLHQNFEFKFPVLNQGGIKVGHVPDWNTVSAQLKDLGWLYKDGNKYNCLGQTYQTIKAVGEDIYSKPEVLAAIKEKIIEARLEELYGEENDE